MKKMTRLFALLTALALLAALGLAGCTKKPAPSQEPSPSASSDPEPAGSEEPASPSPSEEPSDGPESGSPEEQPPEESAPPAQESPSEPPKQMDLDGDGDADYAFDDGLLSFEYRRTEDGETYTIAGADVSFRLLSGSAEALAPGYADAYLDYVSVEYSGITAVGESDLRGERIDAKNDSQQFIAWLVDTPKGVLAITVLAPADASLNGAFAILDSLRLV